MVANVAGSIELPYFCAPMFSHQTVIRVRYAETDPMGVAYHGNYAAWLDVARTEALRSIGVSYKEVESSGIMMPVVDFSMRFLAPVFYDDEITICTHIKQMPVFKIPFEFELYRAEKLLATAAVTLICMDAVSRKPMRCAQNIQEAFTIYF